MVSKARGGSSIAPFSAYIHPWMKQVPKFLHMVFSGEENYDWISTDWLRKWLLVERKEPVPIDNTSLICQHGK